MLGSNQLRGTKRLKFFCQLCSKQCKDEHGWTCHLNSGTHKRKLEEFADNPQEIIEKYSTKFEDNILQILRDKYSGEKVRLGELFRDFINDRTYVDINLTRWKSIDHFWKYLEGVNNIEIDGSYISYKEYEIASAITGAREQKMKNNKTKQVSSQMRFIQEQMRKGQQVSKNKKQQFYQDEIQQPLNQKIQFTISQPSASSFNKNILFEEEQEINNSNKFKQTIKQKKLNNLQKIAMEIKPNTIDQQQEHEQQKQHEWISPGIQVKILPHDLDSKYHNKKASIIKICQPYVAQLICQGVTLQIDQSYLQTVIPKPGNYVMVLVGKYKGQKAILQKINSQQGFVLLSLNDNGLRLSCDEISKLSN